MNWDQRRKIWLLENSKLGLILSSSMKTAPLWSDFDPIAERNSHLFNTTLKKWVLFLAEFGANFIEKYLKTFRRFFTLKRHRRVIKGRGRRDSRFRRLPVTTGYHYFGFRVTSCHWSAEFWTQGGNRFHLFTRISDSGWLRVTTCINFPTRPTSLKNCLTEWFTSKLSY